VLAFIARDTIQGITSKGAANYAICRKE